MKYVVDAFGLMMGWKVEAEVERVLWKSFMLRVGEREREELMRGGEEDSYFIFASNGGGGD